jgi:hypothetical protein
MLSSLSLDFYHSLKHVFDRYVQSGLRVLSFNIALRLAYSVDGCSHLAKNFVQLCLFVFVLKRLDSADFISSKFASPTFLDLNGSLYKIFLDRTLL